MHFLPSQPRSTKYPSASFQRNRIRRSSRMLLKQKGSFTGKWNYWVTVQETCRVPYHTLSGLRLLLRREIANKKIDFVIHASFRVPVTSKPGQRMGTGKGKIKTWLTEFKRGQTLLSLMRIRNDRVAMRAFRLLKFKLPVKLKLVRRVAKIK